MGYLPAVFCSRDASRGLLHSSKKCMQPALTCNTALLHRSQPPTRLTHTDNNCSDSHLCKNADSFKHLILIFEFLSQQIFHYSSNKRKKAELISRAHSPLRRAEEGDDYWSIALSLVNQTTELIFLYRWKQQQVPAMNTGPQ